MRALCLIVVLTTFLGLASGQSMTMSFPQSTSYVNSIPIVWSITPTSQNITNISITFTYVSGYFANVLPKPTYTFYVLPIAPSSRFTLFPLTVNPPQLNISSWAGSPLPMYDGSYTTRMSYVRSDGVSVNSGTASLSISTITLPPVIDDPDSGGFYGRFVNLKYVLPTSPRFSGYPVTMYIRNDSGLLYWASMSSATAVNIAFDFVSLANNSATYVRNATIYNDTLSDGAYNLTVCYIDQSNHPENCTTVYNLNLVTMTPVVEVVSPDPGGLTIFSGVTGVVLNYSLPTLAVQHTFNLRVLPEDVTYLDLPYSPQMYHEYTVDDYDRRVMDGDKSFIFSYIDSTLQMQSAVIVHCKIQRATPPAVIVSPANDTTLTWVSNVMALNVTFYTPSPVYPGTLTLSFFEHDHITPTLVVNMSEGVSSRDLSHVLTFIVRPVLVLPEDMTVISGVELNDNTYRVVVSYRDYLGNAYADSVAATGLVISTQTKAATITLPNNGTYATTTDRIILQFTLPENATENTLAIVFTAVEDDTKIVTFHIANTTAGEYEYFINPQALSLTDGNDEVLFTSISFSWSPDDETILPDDMYNLRIYYRDWEHNPGNYSVARVVIVKTVAKVPVVTGLDDVAELPFNLTYALNETVKSLVISFRRMQESQSLVPRLFSEEDEVAADDPGTNLTIISAELLLAGEHSFIFPDDIIDGIYTITPANDLAPGTYSVTFMVTDLADNSATETVTDVTIIVNVMVSNCTAYSSNSDPYGLAMTWWFIILLAGGIIVGAAGGLLYCYFTKNGYIAGLGSPID